MEKETAADDESRQFISQQKLEPMEEVQVEEKVISESKEERNDFTCGLCYSPVTRPCKLPCGHFFDINCLVKYFGNTRDMKWVGKDKGNAGY